MGLNAYELFDEAIQKSQTWLNELGNELEWDEPKGVLAAMRATLHALRDRLTPAEAAHLGAQLPLVLRGLYFYRLETADLVGLEGLAEKSAKGRRDLAKRGVRAAVAPRGHRASRLAGKTVVFTGRLGCFTRTQAREAVERLGARTASSVSETTDDLVVGEGPGSKLDEAPALGVVTLDEAVFARLIGSRKALALG